MAVFLNSTCTCLLKTKTIAFSHMHALLKFWYDHNMVLKYYVHALIATWVWSIQMMSWSSILCQSSFIFDMSWMNYYELHWINNWHTWYSWLPINITEILQELLKTQKNSTNTILQHWTSWLEHTEPAVLNWLNYNQLIFLRIYSNIKSKKIMTMQIFIKVVLTHAALKINHLTV